MPVAAKNTSSPRDEVVDHQHAVEVVAEVERGAAFVVVARPRAGPGSSRRGTSSAHAAITPSGVPPMPNSMSVPGVAPRDRDRAGDVAVGDEADARAGLAALADDVGVAVAVEDDGGDVADLLAERLRDGFEVGLHRRVDVDDVGGGGPAAIFSMYTHGPGSNIVPRSLIAITAIAPPRPSDGERGAVDRVDRDVHAGRASRRRSARR